MQDVAGFLQEFKVTEILLGVIPASRCPRLTVSENLCQIMLLLSESNPVAKLLVSKNSYEISVTIPSPSGNLRGNPREHRLLP